MSAMMKKLAKRKLITTVRFRGFRLIASFDFDNAVGRSDWPQPPPVELRRVLPM
ncbi:unnamed protein product [Arabidopsis lyrata]|nr:unnamed protein product [Arabidopsis lyrata]